MRVKVRVRVVVHLLRVRVRAGVRVRYRNRVRHQVLRNRGLWESNPRAFGFWLNAWLARPRRMPPKSDLMFTIPSAFGNASVRVRVAVRVRVSIRFRVAKNSGEKQ